MRRRTLLTGLGGLAGSAFLGTPATADPLGLRDAVLLSPPTTPTALETVLTGQIGDLRAMFQYGLYADVATALRRLLPAARFAHAHTPTPRRAADLAELYTLSTELLVKAGNDDLAWTTADRALRAAYSSGDVLTAAIARRAWGIVLRRADRADVANRLIIDTAVELQHDATGGDRDTARTLIGVQDGGR